MAKIDVNFNNKDYYIDEGSFSTATASLRSHLSTVMNGSGATVNLGGTSYNINSTKLSTERNTFVSHLSTIAGSGHKVVIGGVEYGVASDKVSGAISELETVLDNLNTQVSKNIVLEVKKMTSNTYANSTTYNNEEFILLDIYPKTNGTVYVKYGEVTKTITDTSGAAEPAAQQVIFGMFNGVYYDGMTVTPSSGTLTIEGDCERFGVGIFNKGKSTTEYCSCITAVHDWGNLTTVGNNAFRNCTDITSVTIPSGFTAIYYDAFYGCTGLTEVTMPDSITIIGSRSFCGCSGLTSVTIPNNTTSIERRAFERCSGLRTVEFINTVGWSVKRGSDTSDTHVDVTDPVANVTLLTNTYNNYNWKRA